MAQIITMIANAIIPLGNPFEGFSTLFTYGEIFSHPPTANTNIDNEVKYSNLNDGIKFLKLQSIV